VVAGGWEWRHVGGRGFGADACAELFRNDGMNVAAWGGRLMSRV
jgi:hypothetical protein